MKARLQRHLFLLSQNSRSDRKIFQRQFLTKNESDNIHSNSSIFNPCNYRIMEYGELKGCINAAKTEEELLEARKAFRQFKEMGGDAREVAALYQRIKNKATKLVTPKALKR